MPNEKITNGQVDKSPKHIQGRGREPYATRFGKWALKGTPHHAADKMRNGVGEKEAAEEVRCIVKPFHRQALFFRSMTSRAVFGSSVVTAMWWSSCSDLNCGRPTRRRGRGTTRQGVWA